MGYVRVGISTFRLLLGNEASSTVSVAASDVAVELDVVDVLVVRVFRDVVVVVETTELVDEVVEVVEIDDDVLEGLELDT